MGKAVKSVTSSVFGGGGSSGMLGTGSFKGDYYNPDKSAFQNTEEQNRLKEILRQRAAGEAGPSIAEMQLRQATDRNLSQALGQAASQRGSNFALAAREAQRARAAASQQAAGQAAELRADEINKALADYQNELAREAQAKQAYETTRGNLSVGQAGVQQQAFQATAQQRSALAKDLSSGALSLLSDKDSKKNIKKVDLNEFADKIKAYSYQYKNPKEEAEVGDQIGVMAQDLQKSKLGQQMTEDNDGMLEVDIKKAVPVGLAAIAELSKKIKKIEKIMPKQSHKQLADVLKTKKLSKE
jgi:hypothetical protein